MKLVINKCYGGFSISEAAARRGIELSGNPEWATFTEFAGHVYVTLGRDIERNDPTLVQVVEELGTEANGDYAKLCIVEIPDDVAWEIDDYDGMESVRERSRSWG